MTEQTLTVRELVRMIHAQCTEIITMRLYIYRNLFPWFAEGFSKAAKEGPKWIPGALGPIPAPFATLFARGDEAWVALTGLPPITDRLSILSAGEAAGLSHDRIAAMSKTELWDAITAWALSKRSAAGRENLPVVTEPQCDDCKDQQKLIEWITRKGGAVTVRDVQRGYRPLRGRGMARQVLCELAHRGVGRWEVRNRREVFVLALTSQKTNRQPGNGQCGEGAGF